MMARQAWWRHVWLLAAVVLSGLLLGLPTPPRAQAGGVEWQRLGPDARIEGLFAPASGALFARTTSALYRSDDAGQSWREVSLPPPSTEAGRLIYVHALDHRVVYATGEEGLYRSEDDAQNWSVAIPGPRRAIRVAVSPADPSLVYAGLVRTATDFWFLRSQDGGATWQELAESHNSLCGWAVPILQPHPIDPARLFRRAGCYAGRDLQDDLEQSLDQGQTFASLLRPQLAFPDTLVGGMGDSPARWYLAANRDSRSGGSSVFTSADDGASWTEVLQFRGGGTLEPGQPNVRVGGLAYDPARSTRAFVALNRALGADWERTHEGSGLRVSIDAGATWTEVGRQDLPPVLDLVRGIDGAWLFAATTDGVWRIQA